MSNLRTITIAIASTAFLFACDKEPTIEEKRAAYKPQPQQTDVCQAFRDTPKTQMKTFWLGLKPHSEEQNFDYLLSIPQAYFNQQGGAALAEKTGRSDGAILFNARYPDFAPYNVDIKQDYIYYGDWDRSKPPQEYIGLDISILWGQWMPTGVTPTDWLNPGRERSLGLRFKRKDTSPAGWQIEERPSDIAQGLLELDPDMKYDRSVTDRDRRLFIHRDASGKGTDEIRCYKENFGFGNCSHRFSHAQIAMKIRYESAYLKDWKTIKDNTIKVFDCAQIDKRISSSGEN